MRGAAVHVLDLEAGYGAEPLLAGLHLHVAPGEFLALLGPSGVGKSTLLRVLAGLCTPQGGQVQLLPADGAPAVRVGVVFQEPRLLPWRTALDNVALVARGPDRRRRAEEALAAVGLADAGHLLPKQLSGGMAQRVALARALVTEPHVLLLDEPFSAVDALTRLQLHRHLLRLWEHYGFTVILVTHDVDEALYLADRVAVLAGRPARLCRAVTVAPPRPRDRADPRLARLREELLAALAGPEPLPAARAAGS